MHLCPPPPHTHTVFHPHRCSGLLAQLHVDLLQGVAPRSQVGESNWASTLSSRLLSEAYASSSQQGGQGPDRLPFRPVRGREAREYAQLSAVSR